MSAIEKTITDILARTPVGKHLASEAESARIQQHAAARARKAAAIKKFLSERPAAESLLKAAEQKAADARKLIDAADAEWIKAREKLDNVYDTLRSVTDPADRELRECCDPAIDTFVHELTVMRAATPGLQRSWSDPKGPYVLSNGERANDNRAAIQARIVAISNTLDAAQRLKIDADISDVAGAISRLRASIPQA